MSILPYLFPGFAAPSRSFFNNFALSPSPEEILTSMMTHPIHVSDYYRKLHSLAPHHDPSKFQVCLDVHQFAPSEIKVKTIGRQIMVEAQHEERIDEHGYISRKFCRKYTLPQGHEPNDVVSSLSSDGVLTITAPRDPIVLPARNERIVPIMHTGPAQQGTREHNVEHLPEPHHHHHHHHQKKDENAVPLAIKYIV